MVDGLNEFGWSLCCDEFVFESAFALLGTAANGTFPELSGTRESGGRKEASAAPLSRIKPPPTLGRGGASTTISTAKAPAPRRTSTVSTPQALALDTAIHEAVKMKTDMVEVNCQAMIRAVCKYVYGVKDGAEVKAETLAEALRCIETYRLKDVDVPKVHHTVTVPQTLECIRKEAAKEEKMAKEQLDGLVHDGELDAKLADAKASRKRKLEQDATAAIINKKRNRADLETSIATAEANLESMQKRRTALDDVLEWRKERVATILEAAKELKQSPSVWVQGLPEGTPWLECDRIGGLPRQLEENYEMILQEVSRLDDDAGSDEYGYLHASGQWHQLQLFRNGEYMDRGCRLMPETCRVLKEAPFPTRPDLMDYWPVRNNEEAVILFATPGTHVPVHTGAANTQFNVHLPLVGLQGASIAVHPGGRRNWTHATAMCFDDSFAHEVWHEGEAVRVILVVRVMHPAATRQLLRQVWSGVHDPNEL
ncbi:hypothetical protein FOL47_006587 [Perkinsus chesapeaki]|uniref:Aspartyl/asparaginy/proline hydroxylase domain-containing protein n=1 Tax=Perkinsus chesapeaki TaxID=330153 RepID=A0A7J6MXP1_PERCH|nr:hypothetical protein FOL47_006587 [Perkinsus chesapeaki]